MADHDSQTSSPAGVRRQVPQVAPPSPGGAQQVAPAGGLGREPALLSNPLLSGRGNGPVRQAALLQMQQTHGNRAVQRFLQRHNESGVPAPAAAPAPRLGSPAAGRRPPGTPVQRYQAGDTGHGGIEKDALAAAGFSPDEVQQVYLGNWLRDLSQLPPAAFPLVSILALGEFGKEIDAKQLGGYVPSEHLDNPDGGGTIEDPLIRGLPHTDPRYQAALAKLSPDQQAAVVREDAADADIRKNAAASGLPPYIERGKFHIKEKFQQAIRDKETPAGREALGNGLHAVEDYFSHSNFTEVALHTLVTARIPIGPWGAALAKTPLPGAATVGGKDAFGRDQILTGHYAGSANGVVSDIELLKSEVQHGQLTRAFVIGYFRRMGIQGEEIGRRLGAATGGGVGGLAGGAAGGVVGGVVGGIVGGLTGGRAGIISGAAAGGRTGARIGAGLGSAAGKDLGALAGSLAGRSLGEIVGLVGIAPLMGIFPEIGTLMTTLLAFGDPAVDLLTKQSAKQAAAKGLSGPTHSELAKDAPDHALFPLSIRFAKEADTKIGAAIKTAWASPSPANEKAALDLVDKFVSHPESDGWWRHLVP